MHPRSKQFRRVVTIFSPVLALLATLANESRAEGSHGMTLDQVVKIKHPSNPVISPDSRSVVFAWDQGGIANLYVASLSGSGAPKPLTSFPAGQVGEAFWSKDGKTVYVTHEGSLWQTSASGGNAQEVRSLSQKRPHGFALSPDGEELAYVTGGSHGDQLYVTPLKGGEGKEIAHNDASVGAVSWSPDGKRILYSGGSKNIRHEQTPDYSGAKIIYTITERTPGTLYIVPSDGGASTAIDAPSGGGAGSAKWVDSQRVVFDRVSKDFKTRSIYVADASTGKANMLHKDVDAKFWSIPGGTGDAAQPSPNGKWIAFLSDRDGWDHLYVMPSSGGDPVQITSGHFEAWRPAWSHDSKYIAFDANLDGHPGDRHIYVAEIGDHPKSNAVRVLTSGNGTNVSPVWSGDDTALVYQHTDTQHSADLFAIQSKSGAKVTRLSDSMPAGIDHNAFVAPEYVHYPGADGKPVPGWLFIPKNFDKTKKHPAIVWIHGDGVNQNYDGWHVQRNYAVYYSFHQYLLQEGYVVFAPDYRGSIGYGRDWRQGVYMDVGGKDAKDAWLAGKYLQTLPYVDGGRIGVWGLSYGGFFTLIAVTDQPTLFRAGVDVAGVVDYRMYYDDPYHGGWTASRIGTPEEHPKVYDNASPVSHIDRLQSPLLILHGTADINVPYLHSVRLIDEGLKHNKGDLMTFMVYPGEFHYFTREHVLRDAWRRVDEFFHKNLVGDGNP